MVNFDFVFAFNVLQLFDLLKFHENFTTKSQDLKYFTVGPHPEFKESRCFFIVKNDTKKEVNTY